jgi:DNA modification methylase
MSKPSKIIPRIPDLQVKMIGTTALRPYVNNARHHPESQLRLLERSIREYGFVNPLLIDETGMVLCGHGRLEAAIRLGMAEVPTITLSHLNEKQRKAYILADNALAAKAGWSKKMLAIELKGLIDLGYEVELTGFTSIEIDHVLCIGDDDPDGVAAADNELVEEPDDEPPVTRLGDHWVFAGKHHLLCADARDPLSFETLLAGKLIQLTFMDPPFNTLGSRISSKHGNFVMGSGELTDAGFVMDLLRPVMRNIVQFSEPGAFAFVCSDWRAYPRMLDAAAGVFFEQKNLIVWAKTNAGMGSFYRSQTELIPVYKVSRGPTINNFELGQGGRHRSNLWTYQGANTFRRGRMQDLEAHPTVKPQKLVADALIDCSRPGGLVFDPFLGSGTLLAAAHVSGRRGYGIELDPKYCDVILRRMTALTGEEPRLIDGTPLSTVTQLRAVSVGEV